MKIFARLDCSPTEARRLLGQPDLLPLHQIAAETFERWLVDRVLACPAAPADRPGPGPARACKDRGSGRRSPMPAGAGTPTVRR